MLFLANALMKGVGTKTDVQEAVRFLRMAAFKKNPEAMFRLADYLEGGTEEDRAEAFQLYSEAAAYNHLPARAALGKCYLNGIGTEKDYGIALTINKQTAEAGSAQGIINLGTSYMFGYGVDKNEAEAIRLYQKAAEQGFSKAECILGTCYTSKGVEWYQKAAGHGLAEAQYQLGICYDKGIGVKKEAATAAFWFRKAAEQDHKIAQYNLALHLNNGWGVEKTKRRRSNGSEEPLCGDIKLRSITLRSSFVRESASIRTRRKP